MNGERDRVLDSWPSGLMDVRPAIGQVTLTLDSVRAKTSDFPQRSATYTINMGHHNFTCFLLMKALLLFENAATFCKRKSVFRLTPFVSMGSEKKRRKLLVVG